MIFVSLGALNWYEEGRLKVSDMWGYHLGGSELRQMSRRPQERPPERREGLANLLIPKYSTLKVAKLRPPRGANLSANH